MLPLHTHFASLKFLNYYRYNSTTQKVKLLDLGTGRKYESG